MFNLLHISALIAAIAFLILCISLAVTLFSVKDTLKIVANTLDNVSNQMEGILTETTELLNKTNALAADVQDKSAKLNTVVDAVQGVGQSVTHLNASMNNVTDSVVQEAEKNSDKIAQAVQWGTVVINLLQKASETKKASDRGWKRYEP